MLSGPRPHPGSRTWTWCGEGGTWDSQSLGTVLSEPLPSWAPGPTLLSRLRPYSPGSCGLTVTPRGPSPGPPAPQASGQFCSLRSSLRVCRSFRTLHTPPPLQISKHPAQPPLLPAPPPGPSPAPLPGKPSGLPCPRRSSPPLLGPGSTSLVHLTPASPVSLTDAFPPLGLHTLRSRST